MAVPSLIVAELQKVAPSAIIELHELHLSQDLHGSSTVYRFHSGINAKQQPGNIVWSGQTYQAFPITVDGFEYTGNGQLPRPKLRAANVLGAISAILLEVNAITPGNDLIGAKFVRRRTLAKYLDAVNFENNINPYGTPDPSAEFPQEIFYVARKVSENREYVEFELAASLDLQGVRLPRRQCIANICQWQYRSAQCGYTGTAYFDSNDNYTTVQSQDVCGKRLNSCSKRFGWVPNISTAGTTNTLSAGQTLNVNGKLVATNGWYQLIVQADGNVVVYDKAQSSPTSTNTAGNGSVRLTMQTNGDLALYRNSDNAMIWHSDTAGSGARKLIMQNDGNIVLYTTNNIPLWTSPGAPILDEPYIRNVTVPFGGFPAVGSYVI